MAERPGDFVELATLDVRFPVRAISVEVGSESRAGMAVLDCVCGPGSITVGLAEIVAPGQEIGLDIEPRQLETAIPERVGMPDRR